MDSVLRNILDIDQKTAKLSDETEQRLAQNDAVLAQLLEEREKEVKESAKRESDRAYDEIMQSAQLLVDAKKRSAEERRVRMETRYKTSSDRLAQQLLEQLLEY